MPSSSSPDPERGWLDHRARGQPGRHQHWARPADAGETLGTNASYTFTMSRQATARSTRPATARQLHLHVTYGPIVTALLGAPVRAGNVFTSYISRMANTWTSLARPPSRWPPDLCGLAVTITTRHTVHRGVRQCHGHRHAASASPSVRTWQHSLIAVQPVSPPPSPAAAVPPGVDGVAGATPRSARSAPLAVHRRTAAGTHSIVVTSVAIRRSSTPTRPSPT